MGDVWAGPGWEVRQGDAMRLVMALERDSFDGVVTDSPYSSGGMTRGDRNAATSTKYVRADSSNRALPEFAGDTRDQRSFAYWCTLWYAEALRVTRPGGLLFTFTDWRQLPVTTDAVQAGGWVWRGIVPWNKTEQARPQKGRPRAQCEYVVFATKGAHEQRPDAPCVPGYYEEPPAVWTRSPPRARAHITEKPIGLLCDMVSLLPEGGRVLDLFGGSGTTAAAALRTGREVLVFELVEEWAATCAERCEAEVAGLDLSEARAGQIGLGLAAAAEAGGG